MNTHPLSDDLDNILKTINPLWDAFRDKRIFITGGTGFFGCWLLESFAWANEKLKLNAEVVVLTRNTDAFKSKVPHLANNSAIKLYSGDVCNFQFPQGQFDFIIHAATEASAKLNAENPLQMLDTIIVGTRHVLEFARQAGVKKFLLTSSGAVYGKQPSDMENIPEEYCGAPDVMNPHWIYGEGKRVSELLCATYSKLYGIETKIARCFAFVGPYLPLDIHFAIGNFIRDGLKGGPIVVNGDGSPLRSYLYAADLAIGLWAVLLKGANCIPYNIGSDESVSIKDLAGLVAQCFDEPVEVIIKEKHNPLAKAERYVPQVDRFKSLIKMNVVPLKYAIKTTALWNIHRKQMDKM